MPLYLLNPKPYAPLLNPMPLYLLNRRPVEGGHWARGWSRARQLVSD